MTAENSHRPRARDEDGWDEAGASERTVLAWHRSAISLMAIAALVLRGGLAGDLLAVAIPLAVLLVLAAGGAWLLSIRIYDEHDRPFEEGAVLHGRALNALTAVTLITAASAIVVVLDA